MSNGQWHSIANSIANGFILTFNSQGESAGFILISLSGDQFRHAAVHLNFWATNNTTEYERLLDGLWTFTSLGVKWLVVKGESKMVANQVHKDWKCSNTEFSKYLAVLRKLACRFEVCHVYCKDNADAEKLTRRASRREPAEPDTFLEVLTSPSVKSSPDDSSNSSTLISCHKTTLKQRSPPNKPRHIVEIQFTHKGNSKLKIRNIERKVYRSFRNTF